MIRQPRLVLLVLLSLGILHVALTSTPHAPLNIATKDIDNESDEFEASEELVVPEHTNTIGHDDGNNVDHAGSGVKISTPKIKSIQIIPSTTTATSEGAKKKPNVVITLPVTSTHKPFVTEEVLNDLIEASKHSVALADDPRFNKMLPEKYKKEKAAAAAAAAAAATASSTNHTTNKSEEEYDDYDNYGYDDDYNYDETTSPEAIDHKKLKIVSSTTTTTNKPTVAAASDVKSEKKVVMKPIKEDDKLTSKAKDAHTIDNEIQSNNIDDNDDDYVDSEEDEDDDDDDDDEDDDGDDDIADEEEIVFNENVPCPRYCVCARNVNSYLVATCSRFDPGTQKFGSDITDLIVTDVGPKYPILLGPDFFLQMGLKQVSSIKISNCTIEYLHPDAFNGLDELYSVNLTNVGLAIINPDTFSKNKKLRMLTISGNDLSVMSSVHYLLKSSSIEELDLSRNNLMELNPNAFSQLSNIVYINLSQNNIQKIPENVFDKVVTLEELDLSYNTLKNLPQNIFNHTALAILHLKYNSFTGDLRFGSDDLQQLDLSYNSINLVHHGMFDKMTGLTNLNLKGNGITKIQTDSFLTLKNLRHIDLSINELDQVSSMLFYKNSELDVIRLNDNPRLSQLPPDGFLSYNGYFTVYYLDVSNCAIGALGHKTFSTMPHLATLKLAWNNINNLERDTFASLKKLIDLDLSNNLIAKLDELTFMYNNDLTKLNLAGNPMRRLSVRLFLPFGKLRELDVSDCELTTLLSDNIYGVGRKYNFYESLRSFNASANQIKLVSADDVKNFKNLRTLDISHNPLKCNEEFQNFISYVSLNTNMVPKKMPTLANLESDAMEFEIQSHAGWADLAHEVCKHEESLLKKTKTDKIEKRIEQVDKDLDEDAKHLLNIMENKKLQKILKDSRKSEVVIYKDHGENHNEDLLNHGGENKDADDNGDDDDDDEYDEEVSEEDDTDADDEDLLKTMSPKIITKIKVQEIDSDGSKIKNYMNSNDLLNSNGDNFDNIEEEKIIIQRGRIYYGGYDFLIPIIVTVTCVIILLLAIVKVVLTVMHKRGERYRMALLASSKNSIVYQKLSEDIKPTEKEAKQPKVHRYSPINQV